jgi:hypothetical protein
MRRFLLILLLLTSSAIAGENSPAAIHEEPVPLRTLVIAAAVILSPLFAGWALAKNRSKKPPR